MNAPLVLRSSFVAITLLSFPILMALVPATASAQGIRVEGVVHADAELVELVWVELGSQPLADLHPMTKNVLGELQKRLATGPLRHDADVPFFHFYGGRMQRDVLSGNA